MKKLSIIILCLLLMVSAQGCGKADVAPKNSTTVIHHGAVPSEAPTETPTSTTTVISNNTASENKVGSAIAEKTPEFLQVGSIIKTDWLEMNLEKIEITDTILPADTSGVYLYIDDIAGKQYICLRGTVKNLSTEDLDSDQASGKVVINDTYEYDIEMAIGANPASTTDYLLEPFGTSHYYIYAAIPDDAIAVMETGYMVLNLKPINSTDNYYCQIDFAP